MANDLGKSSGAPRPSSLRSLLAWFFVLSFGDYQDALDQSSAAQTSEEKLIDGKSAFERRLRQLIWWPPDVFALTSSVLMRTGAYRMVVGPDNNLGQHLWQRLDWPQRVGAHAEAWRSVISRYILEPLDREAVEKKLKEEEPNLQLVADDKLWLELGERIRERCRRRRLEEQALKFPGRPRSGDLEPPTCNNLLEAFVRDIVYLTDDNGPLADQNLLAVSVNADTCNQPGRAGEQNEAARFIEAIIGLHILADTASGSIGMPRSSPQESAVFDGFANVLLTLRGSLSTAPKFLGVVLPKMRTPQMGLTLRNLSHNLTYHDSEVEVMWRSFPWANFDENTLNVLYVPYPFDFDAQRFEGDTQHYESVGYFSYDPGEWKDVSDAVNLIKRVSDHGIDPHILVFTETAFNETTYDRLLNELSEKYGAGDPRLMPIVVAGVSRKTDGLSYNELRLASHFAGKWYQLEQQKHHRWQLTERQIRQYGLEGHLSTARPLFERTVVGQRRLTFYAPTPWLVLCPLICEDLARIEPVSELIRGVGPTLVLALLLDGPQLDGRWPARYASVLADDPGTGVLTVTSYGAANASRPEESFSIPARVQLENQPAVVASWKDPSSSLLGLPVQGREALLVTLTAGAAQEFTLDRRVSSTKGASFRLAGVKVFDMPETTPQSPKEDPHGNSRDVRPVQSSEIDPRGNWSDIREVTALTYVASAALSLLRPHQSQHPERREERTDSWSKMRAWNRRCLNVRQLIDVMLGRPVFLEPEIWKQESDNEIAQLERKSGSSYKYNSLRAKRDLLLKTIFSDPIHGDRRAYNRHLFAVLGFAQSTADVEVSKEETKWPTNSLRFASTVLRILLDTIAGRDIEVPINPGIGNSKDAEQESDVVDSQVYRNRLRIAGFANRLGSNNAQWDMNMVLDGEVDVIGAPMPLLSYQDKTNQPVKYLRQFVQQTPSVNDSAFPNSGDPTRYDFYRMTLELIEAILDDKEVSLWQMSEKKFSADQNEDKPDHKEMRRLTLLILMMLTALIHEQIEFDYIRLKQANETALSSVVMHSLMKKSQQILTKASPIPRSPLPHNEIQP